MDRRISVETKTRIWPCDLHDSYQYLPHNSHLRI